MLIDFYVLLSWAERKLLKCSFGACFCDTRVYFGAALKCGTMANRVCVAPATNCLSESSKKRAERFSFSFQSSSSVTRNLNGNTKMKDSYLEKLGRDWCVHSSNSSWLGPHPLFALDGHTHAHDSCEGVAPKKYRTARSTRMWFISSDSLTPPQGLPLSECTPYEKIGFACKFLPAWQMGWPCAGADAAADANALRSFCLFDTCVVSDCPYYVTHCVTDEQRADRAALTARQKGNCGKCYRASVKGHSKMMAKRKCGSTSCCLSAELANLASFRHKVEFKLSKFWYVIAHRHSAHSSL